MTPAKSRNPMRRAWILAAALALVAGCDSGQVAAPVNTGVQWTRITNPTTAFLAKYPDWRGNRIAFAYADDKNLNIALCGPDGSNLTYLSRGATENQLEPRWVDDSTLVYTLRGSGATGYDLWMRVLTTDQIRQLTTFAGDELTPAPRPGTSGLAYTEQSTKGRIVLVPEYLGVTPERYYLTNTSMDCGEAAWDPAGQRICFTADSATFYRHVWMITLAAGDSTPVQLTNGPYIDGAPRFSPDGTRILFTSTPNPTRGITGRTGRPGLWTISPSGGSASLKAVAFEDIGAVLATPCWSPDGTQIVTVSTARGGQALWLLSNLP